MIMWLYRSQWGYFVGADENGKTHYSTDGGTL